MEAGAGAKATRQGHGGVRGRGHRQQMWTKGCGWLKLDTVASSYLCGVGIRRRNMAEKMIFLY